uniref:UspA domain-containing protein n=1 Tax=Pyrococcus abyssi (strain GE5 / Orsay) TaxID=272844 RepID=G8ZK51_PYRAB|nr:TPA: hypothetical protein PAB3419a.1n [Pyrococcus abyssi GE5]
MIEKLNGDHSISSLIKTGNKATIIEKESEKHDVLVISRHYGTSSTKTHQVSPVVFRIMQNVEKPVIIY